MQVILLERVSNLGNLGDTVKVKPGYGRNFLLPFGKALPATTKNIAKFEEKRAELEQKAQVELEAAQARAAKLQDLAVKISVNASEDGKLYGSVSIIDIVEALASQGFDVERREVILSDGAIHELGTYPITLSLHTDVVATIQLEVVAS